jgi:hypothetical protein
MLAVPIGLGHFGQHTHGGADLRFAALVGP